MPISSLYELILWRLEGASRATPREEAKDSRLRSATHKREDDERKNEAMQLGQEIGGKLPTKAQENWEGWVRSTGTVTSPVRGRPPQSLTKLKKTYSPFFCGNKFSFSLQVTERTCRDTSLLCCSHLDNQQILWCRRHKWSGNVTPRRRRNV